MPSKRRNIIILGLLLTAAFALLLFIDPVPAPSSDPDLPIPGEIIQTTTVEISEPEQAVSEQADGSTPNLPTVTETPQDLTSNPEQAASGQSVEPIPSMPILTEAHQGFTYRPGQVVTVLAEGFKPGDTLSVTLMHADQGQIKTDSVSPVSPRGNIPIYLPVVIEEAGRYPDGAYTFQVSGSDGTQKRYAFSLDYLHPAEPAPFEGCGIYPEPVLDSIVFVWCTGYEPNTSINIRGLAGGEELFSDGVDTIYQDGVALYVLDIFADDPAGEWRLEIGRDELIFEVGG